MKKIRNIIFILAIAMFATGCKRDVQGRGDLILSEERMVLKESAGQDPQESQSGVDAGKAGREEGSVQESKTVPVIYVQVSGAVKRPGVYELPEGSRVFEAVELAGGLTAEAEEKSFNQAQVLEDGQMLWVLTQQEAADQAASQPKDQKPQDGRINLNTAAKEELMSLPGIGEAKAESILAWREAHGGFAQIEDLMKIEGIKEGVFSKIEDYVRVQ